MKGSKKMAKRLVAMLMAAALTLSLAACGNGGSSSSTQTPAHLPNLPLLTALQLIAAMPLPKQKI